MYKAQKAIIDKNNAEEHLRVERKQNWIILMHLYKVIKTNLCDKFIEKRENFRKEILLKYYSMKLSRFIKCWMKRRAVERE